MFPEELTERFLRIGPSPIGIPEPERFHWFTGTGMVHGVRLGDGCAVVSQPHCATLSVRHHVRPPARGHREFHDHVDRHSRPAKHRDHDLARD